MVRNTLQKFLIENKAHKMTDEELVRLMRTQQVMVSFEDGLVCFMYEQRANFGNPVVQNCRGIILYREGFSIACYPFDKFNNHDSCFADTIDWNSARVLEKLDGQIMKVWFNRLTKKWVVSTQSNIYAEKSNTLGGVTRRYLFDNAESKIDYSKLNENKTYIFEMTSPLSPVMIKYDKTDIWHIGTRDNITQKEEDADIGIQKPKIYNVKSLEEAIKKANELCTPEDRHEGFVVVDKDYHRIKVKSDFYGMCKYMLKTTNADARSVFNFLDKHRNEIDSICEYVPDTARVLRYFQWQEAEIRFNILKLIKRCRKIKKSAKDKETYIKKLKLFSNDNKYERFAYDYYEFNGSAEEYVNSIKAVNFADRTLDYRELSASMIGEQKESTDDTDKTE